MIVVKVKAKITNLSLEVVSYPSDWNEPVLFIPKYHGDVMRDRPLLEFQLN